MTLLLSLLIPFCMGSLLTSLLFRRQMPFRSCLLMKCCLAPGIGIGISSCGFFLWSVVFYPSRDGFVPLEILSSLGLSAVLFYAMKAPARADGFESHDGLHLKSGISWSLSIAFSLAMISAVAAFAMLSWNNPHGEWDAWAIWNMRARFIFRGSDQWRNTFSNLVAWSHPDYPLLISAFVARCWRYIGNEAVVVPAVVSMLFTFATVGLIYSSLSVLRSRSQGLLAGLVLLSTPLFIRQGASQQADVPLGFFFLATIVLLSLQDKFSKNDCSLLFLAGMTTGFAAWTKNEGLLFLAAVIVSRLAIWLPVKERKIFWRQAFPFALGLAPVLITIIYFKTQLAPPNDLLSSQGLQVTLGRLTEGSRYLQVGKAWAEGMIHFGNWVFSLPILLAFYLAVVGIKLEERHKPGTTSFLVLLCLLLAGYFFAYVTSPYDLRGHLDFSLNRLLLQLWPSALFIFFILANTPEESLR